MTLSACLIPLDFLLRQSSRGRVMEINEFPPEVNQSGGFYRLWDLFWSLGDDEARAILDKSALEACQKFEAALRSLPWQPVQSHPHIQQVSDGDLVPLLDSGRVLFAQLERLRRRYLPWNRRIREWLRGKR
jgi:hypothetical protein